MKTHRLWLLFFATLLFSAPALARTERVIPEPSLGYPVLITMKSCPPALVPQASGFFLNANNALYLVTARHVFFDNASPARQLICKQAELVAYSPDSKATGKNLILLDMVALNASGDLKKHATHDVAVVRIGTLAQVDGKEKPDFLPGVQALETLPSGIVAVKLDSVKRFDEVLTASEIYIFGFPSSIGYPNVPQIDYLKPLIRRGIVAGIN